MTIPRFLVFPLVTSLVGLLGLARSVQAQSYDEQTRTYDTQKRLTVSVTRFPEAREAMRGFIRRRAGRVQKQEETPEQLVAEFALPLRHLRALDSLGGIL